MYVDASKGGAEKYVNKEIEFMERFKHMDDSYLGMLECQSLVDLLEFKW